MAATAGPLVAVDVGNSRTKLGLFAAVDAKSATWPEPIRTLDIPSTDAINLTELVNWLGPDDAGALDWRIVSVQRAMSSTLIRCVENIWPEHRVALLTHQELPLQVDLPRPDYVGMDRLTAAVAANFLRDAKRPAVVVDVGTAMTVDLISTGGVFLGGAILPGMKLAAQTLHAACDLLPQVTLVAGLEPPEPLGRSTREAMESGLFWGAVGAMRELISHYAIRAGAAPQVFLSGGFANLFAGALGADASHVPHLVLGGISVAARS